MPVLDINISVLARRVRAVLFNRDGTLLRPDSSDGGPGLVCPVEEAAASLASLRAAGLKIGMIMNEPGLAHSVLTRHQVSLVNARVADLLGPFDTVQICPHDEREPCSCRQPQPGLIVAAASHLRIESPAVVVVSDRGDDLAAAQAAGARGILVPSRATPRLEVEKATMVATSLAAVVRVILQWVPGNDQGSAPEVGPTHFGYRLGGRGRNLPSEGFAYERET